MRDTTIATTFGDDLTDETMRSEVEFCARVDAAEVVEAWITRMAAAYGDAAVTDWGPAALSTEALGDDPEPRTPAARTAVPCSTCGGGGARTVAIRTFPASPAA